MKVLVAYEFSGRIRTAFEEMGWEAWSIDTQESEIPSNRHIVGDVWEYIPWIMNYGFDLLIAHPPCTYTAVSGNRHYAGTKERELAVKDFKFWDEFEYISNRCIEHPVSVISSQHRKPNQYIQPYEFGHGETKKTGLWLTNLPELEPTEVELMKALQ